MSEASAAARAAMKKKASRLTTDPHEKVDASSWEPGDPMNASSKTGMRPISKRAYKRGGKVEGEASRPRMDRKPRKAGGIVEDFMNRNQKEANEDREGGKHIGGLKRGGRAHKADGGFTDPRAAATQAIQPAADRAGVPTGRFATSAGPGNGAFGKMIGIKTGGRVKKADGGGNWIKDAIKKPGALHKELHVPEGKDIPEKKLKKAEHSKKPIVAERAHLAETLKRLPRKSGGMVGDSDPAGLRPEGGRIARKDGGRAKGKTNINIIIGAPKPDAMPAMGAAPPPPMGGPGGPPPAMPMPPGGMPMGAGPGAPPPAPPPQMPPQMPPRMMGRKTGGRVANVENAAGGGLGRLEKIEIQKRAK